jgi:hypothetical protein
MKKEIEVCDYCEEQRTLSHIDGKNICARCSQIRMDIYNRVTREVDTKLGYAAHHRLTLLALLMDNYDPKYWGTEGLKLRADMIASFSISEGA